MARILTSTPRFGIIVEWVMIKVTGVVYCVSIMKDFSGQMVVEEGDERWLVWKCQRSPTKKEGDRRNLVIFRVMGLNQMSRTVLVKGLSSKTSNFKSQLLNVFQTHVLHLYLK